MIGKTRLQKNIKAYYSSGLYVFETKEECEEIDSLIAEWDEYAEDKDDNFGCDYFFERTDEIIKNGHPVKCSQTAYICHLMTKETPKQILLLFQDEHYKFLKELDREKEIGETGLWKLVVNKVSSDLTLYYKEPIFKNSSGEKTVITNSTAYNPAWTEMEIPIEHRLNRINGANAINLMIKIFVNLYGERKILNTCKP